MCALLLAVALGSGIPPSAYASIFTGDENNSGDGSLDGDGSAGDTNTPAYTLPFGEIKRVVPEGDKAALLSFLYLPTLPLDPETEDDEQPPLQTLTVEKAYVGEDEEWTTLGVLTWNLEHYTYESGEILSIWNIFPSDHPYTKVQYFAEVNDYRDFYLRATAVILKEDQLIETVFEPALFVYPEGMRPETTPDTTPETPTTPQPPQQPGDRPGSSVDDDIGGNRGNVVPGTSERVDPESSPKDLFGIESASAAPLNSSTQQDTTNENKAEDASTTSNTDTPTSPTSTNQTPSATKSSTESSTTTSATETEEGPSPSGPEIPGFIWAVGVSLFVVAVGGVVFTARQSSLKQKRKK